MTTLRVPIVASTHAQARLVAKQKNLAPHDWFWAHDRRHISGLARGSSALEALPTLGYTPERHDLNVELGIRDINVETVWT